MPDGYWNTIEQAYDDVSIYDGRSVFLEDLKRYPTYVGDLLSAHWLLSEMSNGGLFQLYLNPTRCVTESAIAAFERMGLAEVGLAVSRSLTKSAEVVDLSSDVSFEEEERSIYEVGGDDLGRIYDRMDAYAAEQKANQPPQPTAASRRG